MEGAGGGKVLGQYGSAQSMCGIYMVWRSNAVLLRIYLDHWIISRNVNIDTDPVMIPQEGFIGFSGWTIPVAW